MRAARPIKDRLFRGKTPTLENGTETCLNEKEDTAPRDQAALEGAICATA